MAGQNYCEECGRIKKDNIDDVKDEKIRSSLSKYKTQGWKVTVTPGKKRAVMTKPGERMELTWI